MFVIKNKTFEIDTSEAWIPNICDEYLSACSDGTVFSVQPFYFSTKKDAKVDNVSEASR